MLSKLLHERLSKQDLQVIPMQLIQQPLLSTVITSTPTMSAHERCMSGVFALANNWIILPGRSSFQLRWVPSAFDIDKVRLYKLGNESPCATWSLKSSPYLSFSQVIVYCTYVSRAFDDGLSYMLYNRSCQWGFTARPIFFCDRYADFNKSRSIQPFRRDWI